MSYVRCSGNIFTFLLLALSCRVADPLHAAEPASEPVVLKYRRIFVPAEELNSQAQGMIPLKLEEFERRIGDWTSRQPNSLAAQVRVERATYSARLEKRELVGGNAHLEFRSTISEPALFAWESTLPLGKPNWDEQPPRPARLGSMPTGDTVLLVEKSGSLTVPWTLRGIETDLQDTSFDLHLPKSTINRLVLQFPVGLMPETDSGIVTRLESTAEESRLLPTITAASSVNWLVELGGVTQFQMRVKDSAKAARKGGLLLVRESATHVLSPVDATSEFGLQLDVHQTSLTSLKLELDATARIIGVRLAGAPLDWHETTPAPPQRTALHVDLPEVLTGSGNGLTVSVVSPLALDRPWRIPRLRLAGGTWQEGTATLVVPPVLQAGSIQFTDAHQTSISPGSLTQPEQTYQFQYLSPLSQIAVQSTRAAPRLTVMGGLVVRHEATQLSAELNLDLAVNFGERFDVEGTTSEEWIVDSVDTLPSGLLEEQQFVPIDGRKFTLRLRLARPLTAQEKTRLVIRAHRQLPAEGESITASALSLVEFQDLLDEQLVVALRATDSTREFQLSGDLDLFRIDPESAAPEELGLLDSSAAGILFRVDRQGEGSRVSVVPSDPRFTAGIESKAIVQPGRVEHRAAARIVPTSSSLARLIIRSTGPIPATMRWKLVDGGDLSITSQTLVPSLSPPTSEGQKESVWELVLSGITTQPLTLEATWETAFSPGEALPLLSFPEAAAQEGLIRVEAGQGVPLRLETEGVRPVPAPLAPAGSYSTIRGLFRYEPGRQATVSLHLPTQKDSLSSAWANRCTLQTRYVLDGAATHEITWHLENHGLDRFPISLPAGVHPVQITIDGESAVMPPVDDASGQHFIPLPVQRRKPVITLTVTTGAPKSTGILEHRWSAPLITTSLPVLDRNWLVTLPPGIQRVDNVAAEATIPKYWHEMFYEIWTTRLRGVFSSPSTADNLEFESAWSETEPLLVSVYSPLLVHIWGIALAIAAAILVIWLVPQRFIFVFLITLLFTCAALLLPSAWSPLAGGVVWGTVGGFLFCLTRPRAISRLTVPRPASTSQRTMLATNLLGCLLCSASTLGLEALAAAAPDELNDKNPVAKIHRVIIPVGSDQEPLGEYVYIDLDFYTLLYRAPERERLPAWLLRSANYDMQATEVGSAASIVMRLELETLTPQAKVALPLHRGEVHLLEGRATLDGEPISLDWNEAGTSLGLEIERPGTYQLMLAFSAAAKQVHGAAHWDLSIPKTPRATLRIRSPSRPENWLLPTARGSIVRSDGKDDLLAEIGPTGTFNVRSKDPRRIADDATEAEQLVWWKLGPGSVTADVLIRVRAVTGKIQEVKLLADPRLRLLPLENEPRVSRVWVEEGESNTVHLTLATPSTETVELRGKVLLLEASGVGKLLLPRLEVAADRITRQWQAISVGKESEVSPDPQIPIVVLPAVEFVDSFGGAASPPNLAFEATGQSPAFVVRPQERIVRAKEIIEISLGRHDAEFRYRADLTGIPPHRFQELIALPAGFRVKQALLIDQEVAVSLRAAAVQQGTLTIHRAQSPTPVQQLVLTGTLPLRASPGQSDLVRLPSLQFAASDGASIRIYRTSADFALIKSAVGLELSAAPEGAPWDSRLGHLLASYKSAPATQPFVREFTVESKANRPSISYRLVTTMERATTRSWSAIVTCTVAQEGGLLDAVRFEVPAEWSGPFELTPAMDHQVVLLPGQTQRHLIIRPSAGSPDKLSFSIRGPVKFQTGETPHAPVLLPLDAVRVDSFLLLPSRVADENLEWRTSGLQALTAGESKDAQLAAPGHEVFRVVAPRFAATLLQFKDSRQKARIVLADLEVHSMTARSHWAKASYYLLPGGHDETELQLPAGSQLVQVLVDDSPVEIRNRSQRSWKVPLGHEHLPQQIVVIYAHHPQEESAAQQATSPVWLGIPVENTVWSLFPANANLDTFSKATIASLDSTGQRRAALAKMSAVVQLVRDAGDNTVPGLPSQQLADWLSRWRLEFSLASQAARLASSRTGNNSLASSNDSLETERLSLEAEFSATLNRFSPILIVSAPPDLENSTDSLPDWRERTVVSQAGASLSQPLTVKVPFSDFAHRLGLVIFFLGVAPVAVWAASSTRFRESYSSSPVYLLVLLAVAALLLLPAGSISAAILAAAAAWFSLRRSWPIVKPDIGSRIPRANTLSRIPSTNS